MERTNPTDTLMLGFWPQTVREHIVLSKLPRETHTSTYCVPHPGTGVGMRSGVTSPLPHVWEAPSILLP